MNTEFDYPRTGVRVDPVLIDLITEQFQGSCEIEDRHSGCECGDYENCPYCFETEDFDYELVSELGFESDDRDVALLDNLTENIRVMFINELVAYTRNLLECILEKNKKSIMLSNLNYKNTFFYRNWRILIIGLVAKCVEELNKYYELELPLPEMQYLDSNKCDEIEKEIIINSLSCINDDNLSISKYAQSFKNSFVYYIDDFVRDYNCMNEIVLNQSEIYSMTKSVIDVFYHNMINDVNNTDLTQI